MLKLDELIGKFEEAELNGKVYKIPVGFNSLGLEAVMYAQIAQETLQKIQNKEKINQEDVDGIHNLIHSAAKIPLDVVKTIPFEGLGKIIKIMFVVNNGDQEDNS